MHRGAPVVQKSTSVVTKGLWVEAGSRESSRVCFLTREGGHRNTDARSAKADTGAPTVEKDTGKFIYALR